MHAPKRRCNASRFFHSRHNLHEQAHHHPNRQAHAHGHQPSATLSQNPNSNGRHHGSQGWNFQIAAQLFPTRFTPMRNAAWHHQKHDGHHQGHKHRVEIRRTYRQFAQIKRIHNERINRAQQDCASGHNQQHTVDQQHRLARDQTNFSTQRCFGCTPCKQCQGNAHHHGQEDQNEDASLGV